MRENRAVVRRVGFLKVLRASTSSMDSSCMRMPRARRRVDRPAGSAQSESVAATVAFAARHLGPAIGSSRRMRSNITKDTLVEGVKRGKIDVAVGRA